LILNGELPLQQTEAHIMSSIEVLWNEANAIEPLKDHSPVETADNSAEDHHLHSVNYDLGELRQRVEKASTETPSGNRPADLSDMPEDAPEDAINRIKSATTLGQQSPKPLPHAINEQSPEYMFGEAFTNLVRHIVIDYLDKSVEPIIREAITSEIKQISKNNSSKKN
jgi:hypothetical protein